MLSILTSKQKDELSLKLLDLEKHLKSLLTIAKETSKPVNLEEPIGRISRMDAISTQSMAKNNKDKLILKLKQINASLNDFENNCYGLCRKCKQLIGYQRLSVAPESPFCISCQTTFEKKLQRKG